MNQINKTSKRSTLSTRALTPAFALSYALVACLMLGCSSTPLRTADTSSANGAEQVPNVELLGQSQLPLGAKILNDRTLIFGFGDSWIGRITMEVAKDTNAAYSFFLEQYPKQGWTVVSSVRGANSLIVLTKPDKSATVEIRDGSLGISAIAVLTVTPKNPGNASQGGAGMINPR